MQQRQRQANKTIEAEFSEPNSNGGSGSAIARGGDHSLSRGDQTDHFDKKRYKETARHRANSWPIASARADREIEIEGQALITEKYMRESRRLVINATSAAIEAVDALEDMQNEHLRRRGENSWVADLMTSANQAVIQAHEDVIVSFRQAREYLLRG